MSHTAHKPTAVHPQLVRGLTLFPAIAITMVDMVGTGPFTTLPNMVQAMGGTQAVFGWIAGAIMAFADGLIWAELGAAMPRAGGTYEYVKQIYGPERLGRVLSFLFVFQLIFSAPISAATGCIGFAGNAVFVFPALAHVLWSKVVHFSLLGDVALKIEISGATLLAMAVAAFATFLIYRRISGIGRISKYMWVGAIGTLGFAIWMGFTHFNSAQAFPPGWAAPHAGFTSALSAGLLIALYDYWGYYNICFLGEEVVDPTRTIPRAMLISIVSVAVLYIAMNVSMVGVVSHASFINAAEHTQANHIFPDAASMIYGPAAGRLIAILIMWTAFASVFALLAGYSRIPFAAARDGNFFQVFERVHPTGGFPRYSVLFLGAVACLCCIFQIGDLVKALVVLRILLLFLVQAVGAVIWRIMNPEQPRPFRMWLYPLPVVITISGFALVLLDKAKAGLLERGLLFAAIGLALYLLRAALRKEWPFAHR